MDDRRSIPSGEGSPRELCDRDSSTPAQGVGPEGIVRGLRHRRHRVPAKDPEIDRALDAMSAPELRAAVRAVLEEFDEDVRASVVDALIARATKATSGWRPTRPSQRIVEGAKTFAEAARHVGHADPDDVTEHLRRATKAFLAGDHASARAVFEAILPPIATVDIDLGQHELVDKPKLATPSMVALIQGARPGVAVTDADRDAAIDAMRIAAEKRVDGILGNSRRQHYGHAALLVASCIAFAPKSRAAEILRWATDLRQQYWRRHAFREELARACESLGVLMSA